MAAVENPNHIASNEDIVPHDIRLMYENKMNIIVDRFTPIISYDENNTLIFVLQVKDFGGNVVRTHSFFVDERDIYQETARFLMKWGLQMVFPHQEVHDMSEFEGVN
jgi:hypothetical protein